MNDSQEKNPENDSIKIEQFLNSHPNDIPPGFNAMDLDMKLGVIKAKEIEEEKLRKIEPTPQSQPEKLPNPEISRPQLKSKVLDWYKIQDESVKQGTIATLEELDQPNETKNEDTKEKIGNLIKKAETGNGHGILAEFYGEPRTETKSEPEPEIKVEKKPNVSIEQDRLSPRRGFEPALVSKSAVPETEPVKPTEPVAVKTEISKTEALAQSIERKLSDIEVKEGDTLFGILERELEKI